MHPTTPLPVVWAMHLQDSFDSIHTSVYLHSVHPGHMLTPGVHVAAEGTVSFSEMIAGQCFFFVITGSRVAKIFETALLMDWKSHLWGQKSFRFIHSACFCVHTESYPILLHCYPRRTPLTSHWALIYDHHSSACPLLCAKHQVRITHFTPLIYKCD